MLPRSEVVFFQAAILLILIISSLAKLLFYKTLLKKCQFGCLFSAAVGFILPSPYLGTKFFINGRLFLSLVGPGSSGYVCHISITLNFSSQASKNLLLHKECQPLFKEIAEKLNIEFVPCLDLEMIKKFGNCLLVFDDSWEEIYQVE